MTADELDALAAIAADVRCRFAKAQAAALTWEPTPVPSWWQPSPRAR